MSNPDLSEIEQMAASEAEVVQRDLKQAVLSGLALTVPLFITILVLLWIFGIVQNALAPLAGVLDTVGLTSGLSSLVTELVAAALVAGFVVAVGLAAQHGPDTNLGRRFDVLLEDMPGIGSIYTSVERMSDVIVEGDTDSFREVKLVEFPREGNYALAFLTAKPTSTLAEAAGCDSMRTVFVPMAPNPVMGGHLIHLPTDRVHDVDLTVEEGMEAIVTTGLALDQSAFDDPKPSDD